MTGRVIAMKAGVASPDGVTIQDVDPPKPKPTDILVKIKAIALNRADLGSARGDTSHGAAAGKPIGSEFAGEVIEVGGEVRDFKVGDRVMCHSPGSHAEMAVSDYGRAMKIPDGMSYEQAATLPIGLNTLHNALVTAGRLKAGETVMVQGASSGVGIIGLQIAKLMGAKFVVGTSTNDARRARLKEFGADLAVSTKDADWPEQVLKATGGKGAQSHRRHAVRPDREPDHALHRAARPHRQHRPARRHEGRVRLRRPRPPAHRLHRRHLPHPHRRGGARNPGQDARRPVGRRQGRPHQGADRQDLPLAEARAGHEHMRANQHFGKILLIP